MLGLGPISGAPISSFGGATLADAFGVIVWMEAWVAYTETRADVPAVEATLGVATATAGVATLASVGGGVEVAVDLQAPSTSVSGDVGGAGAVLEAGGAAGSAQGYVQAAGVDVGAQGVGAGVLTSVPSTVVALDAAHRVWQHFARPPVVHATPTRRQITQLPRLAPILKVIHDTRAKGVSRWRT